MSVGSGRAVAVGVGIAVGIGVVVGVGVVSQATKTTRNAGKANRLHRRRLVNIDTVYLPKK